MATYEKRLDALDHRIRTFIDEHGDGDQEVTEKSILRSMKGLCALGREAERDSKIKGKLDTILSHIEGLLYQVVEFYKDEEVYDYTASFAHTTTIKHKYQGDDTAKAPDLPDDGDSDDESGDNCPLVIDTLPKGSMSYHLFGAFTSLMEIMRRSGPNNPLNNADQTAFPKPPAPWWNVTRPHPGSSGLSRFRENAPVLSATNATPIALNVYQARCEIKADSINTPVRIFSSFSGTDCILSIPSMGGWKDRTPVLQYIINAESTGSTEHHTVDESFTVGLEAIAYHSAIDPSRKLLFVGDSDRIKSFEWGKPETDGNYHKKAKAAHTLDSDELDGPMIVIGDGRFMRAGQGKIGVWNLNDLTEETHAKLGKKPIGGRKISIEDSWRDDPEDIERSWGTAVGQTIKLWLPNLNPGVMAHHPSGTANLVLLAAQYDRGNSHSSDPVAQYSCVALDIERGKPVSKILGHGDIVAEFSTSRADPNVFATGCGDGYVRLFDVRTHFPVITFDATERDDECGALALTHPDGIPSLFTGSSRGETIKFWDIRAQAVVYDLGTGNNAVSSLAWDEHRRTLYAAAPCEHVTRHGDRVDYRKLQVPKPPKNAKQQRNREAEGEDDAMDENNDPEWEDDDDDEGEDEYGNYAGRGWPKKAQHGEDYYPHLFDAASHRLFRYTFKTDPNPDAVPVCDY